MIILFGLNLLGILKIPGTQRDRGYPQEPAGHVGSLLIGMGFGAGWTPCIGPILASILTVAAVTTSLYQGILLLVVYSSWVGYSVYHISACNRQIPGNIQKNQQMDALDTQDKCSLVDSYGSPLAFRLFDHDYNFLGRNIPNAWITFFYLMQLLFLKSFLKFYHNIDKI